MSMDVSFLIPAYNEQHHLQSCVTSISQFAPAGLSREIVIADNYSLDDTFQIAKSFDDEHEDIRAYKCEGPIGRVRNFLADAARGNVLVFLDADTLLTQQWADRFLTLYGSISTPARVITGSIVKPQKSDDFMSKNWFSHLSKRQSTYLNGAHMIIKHGDFDAVGQFASQLVTGEDVEFCRRAESCGFFLSPDSELVVMHQRYPHTISEFFNRERWHAYGDYQSVSNFLRSKTAMAGVAYIGMMALAVFGVGAERLIGLSGLVIFPTAFSFYKFKRLSVAERANNLLLSSVYLTARALPKWEK